MAATSVAGADVTPELEASKPPEARGIRRDEVRLLVSEVEHDTVECALFRDLPLWLRRGDVLVVNTSGTMNAALRAETYAGQQFELHLSTPAPGASAADYGSSALWIVELRLPGPKASLPYRDARAGLPLRLPAGGRVTLREPYPPPSIGHDIVERGDLALRASYLRQPEGLGPEDGDLSRARDNGTRLWLAELELRQPWRRYLDTHGFPIRYNYVPKSWPLSMYQTVFATEPGSAEMPSAGRPFSCELVTTLVAGGIQFAPVLLHTGVSSLEDHEPPYEEYFRVSTETADLVNAARRRGSRVVGVGTTTVRALETVTDERGRTSAGSGWTSLVVGASHQLRSVDSLITGLHEPRASHLAMLDRVARSEGHVARAYDAARREGYLWHEFGDSHLILGPLGCEGRGLAAP